METNFTALTRNLGQTLAQRPPQLARMPHQWDAAVLLPLVETKDGPGILFEARAQTLDWQPGDICFPGGGYECKDKNFAVTASREVQEELGLPAASIKILGGLNYLVTYLGPIVHPYVGTLTDLDKIVFNKAEVDHVFTVPLAFLKDYQPREVHMESATRAPEDFPYELAPHVKPGWFKRAGYKIYFYQYAGHVIWGLTGRILHSFLQHYGKDLFK